MSETTSPVRVQVGNGTGDCRRPLANHCGWGMRANCGIHGTVRQVASPVRVAVDQSCGQSWVAEIERCPRCRLDAGKH